VLFNLRILSLQSLKSIPSLGKVVCVVREHLGATEAKTERFLRDYRYITGRLIHTYCISQTVKCHDFSARNVIWHTSQKTYRSFWCPHEDEAKCIIATEGHKIERSDTRRVWKRIMWHILWMNALAAACRLHLTVRQRIVSSYWKGYAVKHNCVTWGVFNGYTGQLHVSAYTGHLQVVFQRT